jgi:hypothetical protein
MEWSPKLKQPVESPAVQHVKPLQMELPEEEQLEEEHLKEEHLKEVLPVDVVPV